MLITTQRLQSENKMTDLKHFYHYTTEEGAEAIKRTGVIKQSKLGGPDGAFGSADERLLHNRFPFAIVKGQQVKRQVKSPRVYGTTLSPLVGLKEIAKNNWGHLWLKNAEEGKLEYAIYIMIPKNELIKAPSKRKIYIHKGDIILKKYKWRVCDPDFEGPEEGSESD
ncbi:hypothetical protein BaRGS_00038626 [Batillaria attramentaria]|uniref:Uncharacterized protein n=1 Tax=Batillaria attramentaria TaxID=370345 RepID=A0ABD0J5Y0_9CAEN